MLGLIYAIVGGTHRLRGGDGRHAHPHDLSAPLPLETAHGLDEMTEREAEAERRREPAVSRRS
jgi:hypothetical protein